MGKRIEQGVHDIILLDTRTQLSAFLDIAVAFAIFHRSNRQSNVYCGLII